MIEQTCDLWAPHATPENLIVRCITTNGDVNRFGEAVMGRGVAKQTIDRVSEMPRILGKHLRKSGNVILGPKSFYLNGSVNVISLLTFPVKHHWHQEADVELIRVSSERLKTIAEGRPYWTFLLPRPGCGNGRLLWSNVRGFLLQLPNNVIVINKGV